MLIALSIEREIRAPVLLPDEQLDFYAELYLANPCLRSRHRSFEQFVVFVVRNGTLFEKLRCPRVRRRKKDFRPRKEAL